MSKHTRGFTLIELLIVVVIIAVLGAIAYPAYTNYVFRTNRAEGQSLLLRIASEQERHFTQFNRYALDLVSAPPAGLGMTSVQSENGYYTASVVAGPSGNNQTFRLTAAPQGRQADDECKDLRLNSLGTKSFTGNESNGPCW